MSPEVSQMTGHLNALNGFIVSDTHKNFVNARLAEIAEVKKRILVLRPDTQLNISLQLQAFGELDCLEEMLTTFEDAAFTLRERISEVTEKESKTGTTTKV